MNNRENNKSLNRQKILAAAKSLLNEGGLDALSMRVLAERAKVSSRTPYNLFGSKTDVLLGLLDEPLEAMLQNLPASADSVLQMAMLTVQRVHDVYAPEIEYYRQIYWGIMSSGHHEARVAGLERAREMATRLIRLAIANGELKPVDARALADHLVMMVAGFLGLWASSLMTGRQLVDHVRLNLGMCFLAHCTEGQAKKILKNMPRTGAGR